MSRTTPASALSTCCRSTGALASCSCSWGFDVLACRGWPEVRLGSSNDAAGQVFHAMPCLLYMELRSSTDKSPSSHPLYRNTFPAALWEKIEGLFPARRRSRPVCVDIAIGAEGRGGVELARRQAVMHVVCSQSRGSLKQGAAGRHGAGAQASIPVTVWSCAPVPCVCGVAGGRGAGTQASTDGYHVL